MPDGSKDRVLRVDPHPSDPSSERAWIERAVRVVKTGGLVAFPTETFYGLAADPYNSDAIDRLFRIKGRESGKPIGLVLDDIARLEGVVKSIPAEAAELIRKFWPGPLTLLLNIGRPVSPKLTGGTGKIGVRIPSHPVALRFLRGLGQPVTATSANPSGYEPAQTAEAVRESFAAGIDLILDGGPAPGGEASTIVDATLHPPRLIREGKVPFGDVLRCLGLTPTEDHEW